MRVVIFWAMCHHSLGNEKKALLKFFLRSVIELSKLFRMLYYRMEEIVLQSAIHILFNALFHYWNLRCSVFLTVLLMNFSLNWIFFLLKD